MSPVTCRFPLSTSDSTTAGVYVDIAATGTPSLEIVIEAMWRIGSVLEDEDEEEEDLFKIIPC